MNDKELVPRILDSEDDIRAFIKMINDTDGLTEKQKDDYHNKQIQLIKNAKFMQEYQRFFTYNRTLRERANDAMKYDRLRKTGDIRNIPDEQLATYQRSQKRMILEDTE